MTMRFIFTCMVIVGLSLLALPLIPAFNGIQAEREAILASAASGVNLQVPPPIKDEAQPTSLMAMDADAAALSNIEPTAGGDAVTSPDTFTGGFSGQAPAALEPQAPAQPTAE